MVAAN
jgi:hypothetical protein